MPAWRRRLRGAALPRVHGHLPTPSTGPLTALAARQPPAVPESPRASPLLPSAPPPHTGHPWGAAKGVTENRADSVGRRGGGGRLARFASGFSKIGGIHWGWGEGSCLLRPPLPGDLGSGTGGGGHGSASGEGPGASREAGRAATAAAPITFSPDLISHQGSCNFFQFST